MSKTPGQRGTPDPDSAGSAPVLTAAMSDWRRTFRLCLILACQNLPVVLAAWLAGHR